MPIWVRMFGNVVSRRSSVKLYVQVADQIREKILNGTYRDKLPPESRMAHEHDVSTDTVRNALRVLRSEGLIISDQGKVHRVQTEKDREPIWLRPGEMAVARAPSVREREQFDLYEGVPVIVVGDNVYPADRYAVGTPDAE